MSQRLKRMHSFYHVVNTAAGCWIMGLHPVNSVLPFCYHPFLFSNGSIFRSGWTNTHLGIFILESPNYPCGSIPEDCRGPKGRLLKNTIIFRTHCLGLVNIETVRQTNQSSMDQLKRMIKVLAMVKGSAKSFHPLKGEVVKGFTLSWGRGAKKGSNPQFSHFVAPPLSL